jgi:hypothetical protein
MPRASAHPPWSWGKEKREHRLSTVLNVERPIFHFHLPSFDKTLGGVT